MALSIPLYISHLSQWLIVAHRVSLAFRCLNWPSSTSMAKALSLLLLVCTLYISGIANLTRAGGTNFIESSCRSTQYPSLCVECLSAYASTIQQNSYQLVQAALSVSLDRAVSAKTYVSSLCKYKGLKPREYGALRDCLDEIGDTVDRLRKSVQELKQMGASKGQDFTWHVSNIQTWVSAALTEEDTCLDGFAGKGLNGKTKDSIKTRIVNVAQVTSNALSLINQYASKY